MTVIIRDLDKPAECVGCRFCLKDHGRDYCIFDGEYIDWADGTVNLDCPLEEYEAVPVIRRGYWEEYTRIVIPRPYNHYEQAWKCSECGYDDGFLEWKYCPECGAKMEDR